MWEGVCSRAEVRSLILSPAAAQLRMFMPVSFLISTPLLASRFFLLIAVSLLKKNLLAGVLFATIFLTLLSCLQTTLEAAGLEHLCIFRRLTEAGRCIAHLITGRAYQLGSQMRRPYPGFDPCGLCRRDLPFCLCAPCRDCGYPPCACMCGLPDILAFDAIGEPLGSEDRSEG